jgi:hypothetical protein
LTKFDTSPNVEKEMDHNQPSNSFALTKKTLTQMGDIKQKIINEIKQVGV